MGIFSNFTSQVYKNHILVHFLLEANKAAASIWKNFSVEEKKHWENLYNRDVNIENEK